MPKKINLDLIEQNILSHIQKLEKVFIVFLEKELKKFGSDWWSKNVKGKVFAYQRDYIRNENITSLKEMDLAYFLSIFCGNWEDFKKLDMFTGDTLIYVKETRKVFNRWKHRRGRHYPDDIVLRDLDTLKRIGNEFNLETKITNKLENLWVRLLPMVADNFLSNQADSIEHKQVDSDFKIEKEILAVDADITKHLIDKYQIHSCPDNHRRYSYKPTKYITFFDKNGEMDTIYEIKEVIIVDRSEDTDYFYPIKQEVSGDEWERIMKYSAENPFQYNDRFYILSKDNIIKLDHKPKSKTGDASGVYFTFSELQSGNKVVTPY
jgi:hypothetical protein